ncbi:elongator complex protein 4 isoform X1 [Corythoichthys intestinalis]|uniref:elongator complex protein 4 isoform X1 n=2 Tax=Corythoichthys intestinalis TaxID=161448 RepID=UPI0025A603B3|nr:elongator complex protein 4 isoform X1 [Corythoichthys intestinalis]XP_061796806.1 elongator complex protein 4-like [Nerophis lumbriciformis]
MAASVSSACKPSMARIPVNTTSFQKRTKNKLLSIPGTRLSVQNGQLLVSTGVTSLDYLLGGGLAVGTVLLIEEDRYDSYSRMILKYFLAEGVVCRHELFLAAVQDHPNDIFQELPDPILDDVAMHKPVDQPRLSCEPQDSIDAMKIAWRYQNLPKVQNALASTSRFGHYYDVSKTMEPEIRQAAKCHHFYLPEHPSHSSATHSSMLGSYSALLKSIEEVIRRDGFSVATTMTKSRNILRIGLHSLGSPLWDDDLCCQDNPKHSHALTTFLYGLRALMRSSLSVAVVTVPSHLIQSKTLMGSITRLCDNAIALESFKGSERETSPLYKDYHGLLHVRQVPYLNCLASQLPDHKDLAFKLKRKQFTIERLHLPPDLSETVSRVSRGELAGAGAMASACGSGNKHLDF